MKDTPTREVTVLDLKEKMAPRRAVEVTFRAVEYSFRPVPPLLPSPRKVLNVGSESK